MPNKLTADAYFNRAVDYFNQGHYDKAIKDYDAAIKLNPEKNIKADAYFNRAIAYSDKGHYDKAIEDYDAAIELNPEKDIKAKALINRAAAYYKQGNYEQELQDYDATIELNPEKNIKARAYLNRAVTYGKQGDYEQAIKDCDAVIKLNPEKNIKVRAYLNRAITYYDQGNYEQELQDYDAVIELNPEKNIKVRAYLNRALAYDKQGNYEQALKDYDAVIKLNPEKNIKARAYFNRAVDYFNQGHYDKAIEDCDAAIELNPEKNLKAVVYFYRASAYGNQGDYAQALQDYTKAGEYNPELIAINVYAYIAVVLKDVEGGENIFEHIINLYNATNAIKTKLFVEQGNKSEFAHYTSLTTLKSLTSKDEDNSKFRLYNTAYMHDPQEGKPLFAAIKIAKYNGQTSDDLEIPDDLNIEEYFYQTAYPSPAYVASFVKVDKNNDSKDDIMLWRAYGNDGSGSCLIFQRDTFAAAELPLTIAAMRELSNNLSDYESPGDAPAKQSQSAPKRTGKSPESLPLYQVVYVKETGEIVEEEIKTKLSGNMDKIKNCLIVIKKCTDEKNRKYNDSDKKIITRLTCAILDDIRYLFKSAHFKHEQERRIVEMRYGMSDLQASGIEIDDTSDLPKLYIDQEIPFSEIILGPCSPYSPQQWQLYLKYKESKDQETKQREGVRKDQKTKLLDHIEITQSTIQYKPAQPS